MCITNEREIDPPPGGLEISGYDSAFAEAMEIAEQVMREDRDMLKKPAQ